MRLNEEELKHIAPGVYRGLGRSLGPPFHINDKHDEGLVAALAKIRKSEWEAHGKKYPNYVSSPSEFLDMWIAGYKEFPKTSDQYFDGGHLSPKDKGFELYYVNWREGHSHNVIARTNMVYEARELKRLQPVMLASDINGMNDQKGYMNVGINDFESKRVLVWRSNDESFYDRKNVPYDVVVKINPKVMHDDIKFYVWDIPDHFPFESPNLLKSGRGGANSHWTLVGFEPQEVYAKFQQMGFVFPPVRNKR